MTYTWKKECMEKYGKEATAILIHNQEVYEKEEADNDCKHCGKGNQGAVVQGTSGPYLVHFGLWSNNCCLFCGKASD